MAFDFELVKESIKNILIGIGEDPNRPGLVETPDRVARMYREVFEGVQYTNDEIGKMFDKCFTDVDTEDLVVIGNIPVFSYCEHHMALMYNMKISVGYIPNGKIIGLSKVARIADMVCKRLQVQERIGTDMCDILQKVLNTENVMVVIEGEHSCMTARGIKKPGTITRTASIRGCFKEDYNLREEFYSLIKEK